MAMSALAIVVSFDEAMAADGDLDLSFGVKGSEYIGWQNYLFNGDYLDAPVAVLAQRDGKIVLVGSIFYSASSGSGRVFGVARLLADGTPDTTFGDGVVPGQIVLAAQDGSTWIANGATLDASGNIIIVGSSELGTTSQAAIWKLTAAGVPQPSFGSGTGMVFIDRGASSSDEAVAVVAGDGTNEALGTLFVGAEVADGISASHTDAAVFFLAADGTPLVTSSVIGNQTLPNGGRFWRGPASCPFDSANPGVFTTRAVSFDAQFFAGNSTHYLILSGNCASATTTAKVVVMALDSHSNLDSTFGSAGASYLAYEADFAHSTSTLAGMAVSFDNFGNERITLVGRDFSTTLNSNTIGVARLRVNGEFDPTFGFSGQLTINGNACCRINGNFSEADSVLIQHDGKTVLGATVKAPDLQKILLRLAVDGTGDATFGTEGQLAGSHIYPDAISGESADSGTLTAFTAGEKILAAAYGVSGDGSNTYVTLLRAENDLIFTANFDPLPAPVPI